MKMKLLGREIIVFRFFLHETSVAQTFAENFMTDVLMRGFNWAASAVTDGGTVYFMLL